MTNSRNPAKAPATTRQKEKGQVQQKRPRPIGQTATGKPTAGPVTKEKVDETAEASFPASDPPAGAAGTASGHPAEDISPARYVDPQEKKRKPR